jgi:AcrR family transcriptional regulator
MARPRTDIRPRILRAARKRFRQSGVDGASLRAIARDAKTSIGMIYYYFPTKDDLFFAVVEESYEKILADLERILSASGGVEERLVRLYERVADATDEEVETVHLVGREALSSSARRDRLVQRFTRGHIGLIFRTVLEGVREGAFDAKRHPAVLFLATFSLAFPPQLLRRVLGDKLPAADVPAGKALARELVHTLFHGVGASPS